MVGVGGAVLLHRHVLVTWSWHLPLDDRQKTLRIPYLVPHTVDCCIALIFFASSGSSSGALRFLGYAYAPLSELTVLATFDEVKFKGRWNLFPCREAGYVSFYKLFLDSSLELAGVILADLELFGQGTAHALEQGLSVGRKHHGIPRNKGIAIALAQLSSHLQRSQSPSTM